jgi:hypothetical protein
MLTFNERRESEIRLKEDTKSTRRRKFAESVHPVTGSVSRLASVSTQFGDSLIKLASQGALSTSKVDKFDVIIKKGFSLSFFVRNNLSSN